MSFAAYNGVRQITINSCAAFSMAAALHHFGLTRLPHLLDTDNLAAGYTMPGAHAFAQDIYQITGNLFLDLTNNAATYRYGIPVSDRNSFSALTYVASQFGLSADRIKVHYNQAAEHSLNLLQVTNPTGKGSKANLLQVETDLITGPPYAKVAGPVDYAQTPRNGEAHLLIVSQFMHSIVINETECYDPGTGYVGPYTTDVIPGRSHLTEITYRHHGLPVHLPFSGFWMQMS
ncbi:hypothetical protein F0L74_20345 [Chitinophaga agrisoli]|uniref:Peptidase C39-like domain-containing protein n=1 Tax=Chitinophaga agrisoli TaxID=2607653 RepID=A0A5B2VJ70_9BACT|nr:hypothetical protein [Chitinophaga agrisoli]KAA2238576.1 hypothetical protein F0L74_20345 [Chitinophaga agrisoli]